MIISFVQILLNAPSLPLKLKTHLIYYCLVNFEIFELKNLNEYPALLRVNLNLSLNFQLEKVDVRPKDLRFKQ